ncbi:efflux transporter MtrCDE transcriptional activator MtrA [Neisseria meningitidis]|uniref:efflux transporter MtrCDE transcriptional activator MtrA n=1 Tax=Neisseria meningitidis TaxID=487 RepID=UPI000FCA5699|nr:efflux transporter MtrCDE transcriptional activator MtrA [Neisseria meningitidis]
MDILDKLVDFAQLTGSVDVQCLLGGQWSVRHETLQREGLVHIVTSGSGYLCIDGEPSPRPVSTGDIVFFPRGLGHVLSHDGKCGESLQPDMRQHGAFTVKQCGNGQDMSLFCARFRYDTHADLMNGLPETVFLNIAHPSLQYVVSMLQLESKKPLTGTVSVVNALSSVLLVLILRAYLEQDKDVELSGVLKGWQDKRLGHLIQKVIDKPEDEWNVDKMVAAANMSRAQLMRRFKSRVGLSPHAFVNHIRLQKGALLLKKNPDSVLSVALSVGFQSETHFGKAFKRQYHVSPGQYRKEGGQK